MNVLIDALSALMVFVSSALVGANLLVVIATILHKRRAAMRFLAHFSRAVSLLRLSDGVFPSRPYRHR